VVEKWWARQALPLQRRDQTQESKQRSKLSVVEKVAETAGPATAAEHGRGAQTQLSETAVKHSGQTQRSETEIPAAQSSGWRPRFKEGRASTGPGAE
jgi:hypothetical protein